MKKILKAATVAASLLGVAAPVLAQSAYEPYRGSTIHVLWPSLGHFNKAEQLIEEFEQLSGINVEVTALPYLSLREKQLAEMARPVGEFDLVSWVIMWKSEYVAKGLLTPLAEFFADQGLADPTYDAGDFAGAYLVSGGIVGGKKGYLDGPTAALYGVPFGAETSLLAYRKDIFEAHDIAVPKTYNDLRAAMLKLKDLGIPAMTTRGRGGNDVTFAWLLHLSPLGGRIFDDAWLPQLNSSEAIEAAEFLRLIVETGPENVDQFNFGQSAFEFLQGGAAMYLDNLKIVNASKDPSISSMPENIGFAPHPAGKSCSSETGGFAIGVPSNSDNAKAAFLLLQYLTSKQGDQRMFELGGDASRISTLFNNSQEHPELTTITKALACANPDWRPLIPEWSQIQNTILGPALLEVTRTKKPIQEIMEAANIELRSFMDAAGYYGGDS